VLPTDFRNRSVRSVRAFRGAQIRRQRPPYPIHRRASERTLSPGFVLQLAGCQGGGRMERRGRVVVEVGHARAESGAVNWILVISLTGGSSRAGRKPSLGMADHGPGARLRESWKSRSALSNSLMPLRGSAPESEAATVQTTARLDRRAGNHGPQAFLERVEWVGIAPL